MKFWSQTGIFLLKLISRIPLSVLYGISDLLYFVIYHVVKYRRKVVRVNLLKSFPEKTDIEIKSIERKYYRYLCDLTVEVFKTRHLSSTELQKRMVIKNPEVINRFYEEGRSVIVMASHFGNWEWLLHMPLAIRHHQFFVYKPLQNERFDKYMNGIRSKFGGETISMSLALRKIIEADKKKIPVMTWLAADQTPPWFHHFWTIFLNQEAQFFDGPAKIAQRFDHPVIFQWTKRIKRGYYETWFEVLFDEPAQVPEEKIILAYVERVEQVIKTEPEFYLWSHRRWKNARPPEAVLHTLKKRVL